MKHYELPWPSRWPARLRPARPRRRATASTSCSTACRSATRGRKARWRRCRACPFHRARRDLRHHRPQRRGKSTLLRTINMLERPGAGRVLIDGADVGQLDEDGLVALRRRIGMIFQHFNLLSAKTVAENVALPLRVAGVKPPPRASGSTRCWTWWACATRPMPIRPSCPAARSSGSASPARWCTSRGSCCATKPRRRWIPRPPNPSWRCCATSTASSA